MHRVHVGKILLKTLPFHLIYTPNVINQLTMTQYQVVR